MIVDASTEFILSGVEGLSTGFRFRIESVFFSLALWERERVRAPIDHPSRETGDECRVERAEKNMRRKITVLTLCAMLFALSLEAETQQQNKAPRIGFLIGGSPSAVAARTEAFRQGLRELGYVEGKNIVIEFRYAEGKLDRVPALAAELVRFKVDIIVTTGAHTNPCRQGSDEYNSDCHGAGQRSCWKRVRGQPCASGRKHNWIVQPCPGVKRKTTGASEGDRSQALPRGRLRDFDQPGQRTIVKRDRNSPQERSECSFNT